MRPAGKWWLLLADPLLAHSGRRSDFRKGPEAEIQTETLPSAA